MSDPLSNPLPSNKLFGHRFVVHLSLQPHHMKDGRLSSTLDHPLALAIKDKLNLDPFKGDLCAIGDDEIFLVWQDKRYLSDFQIDDFFSHPFSKPRLLTLKFREF